MLFDAPLPPWWREAFTLAEPTPVSWGDKVVAAGDGGVRAICAVLDPRCGEGRMPRPTEFARECCAQLLSRVARPELIPWLHDRMDALRDDARIPVGLTDALAACGPEAASPTCVLFATAEPGDLLRPWYAEAVAHCNVMSDESLAVLVSYLGDDPIHGAHLLVDYGDVGAVDALLVEFDRTPIAGPDADLQTFVVLGSAVETLGGELGDARAAGLRSARVTVASAATEQRRRWIAQGALDSEAVPLPAPEDPCLCESGATYASCCAALEADLAESFRQAQLRPRHGRFL